ncbi:MAG: hypothetical protein HKN19_08950 [Halioglobus sp.]|nr:hypothetical protein [Halioglobus sp.]
MQRHIIILLAVSHLLTGVVVFVAPQWFYDTVPGVAQMGPFNLHFIRDAGLAYAACGILLALGWQRRDYLVCMAGCTWICFHALYHAQMWVARGMPADLVAWVNLFGIQVPAWLPLILALTLWRARKGADHA